MAQTEYRVSNPVRYPHLLTRSGKTVLVDKIDMDNLCRFTWFEIKSHARTYIARRIKCGKKYKYIRLHREIMNCPEGMEVHHINLNTYDNRRCNLVNVNRNDHSIFHKKNFIKKACHADKNSITLLSPKKDRAMLGSNPSVLGL